jgi:hypothetical protein
MAGFTASTETLVLTFLLTNISVNRPSAVYVGLFTATPTDVTPGTEVSGNSYSRKVASFSIGGGGPSIASNSSSVIFNAATGSWGQIVAAGVFDAPSGGNLLAYAAIAPRNVSTGDVIRIPSGDLDITLN